MKDPAGKVQPDRCVISFCAAELPFPEPIDTRTQKQVECEGCNFSCGMSAMMFAPGPMIPLTLK